MKGKDILVPVLLSALVFPGAGQVRNRDVLKGTLMGILSLALFVGLLVMIMGDLWPLVVDPPELGVLVPVVQAAASRALFGHGVLVTLLVFLWSYSVVDAYFVARRRASNPPLPPVK